MVTRISDITTQDITDYIRLGEISDAEHSELTTFLKVAKNYCENYTGIPLTASEEGEETLDDFPDVVIAVYVLCQDMYDNRAMYVNGASPNKVVQTILDMHCRNLL